MGPRGKDAIANEMRGGLEVIASGETLSGAARFASGVGRHGAFGGEVGKLTEAAQPCAPYASPVVIKLLLSSHAALVYD